MRIRASVLVAAFGLAASALPVSANILNFSTFVSGPSIAAVVGGNSTIGFAYAGNKFVGSVYFNPQLYATDLNGGNVVKFGAPEPVFTGGETYVTSSLGIGGFGTRDVSTSTPATRAPGASITSPTTVRRRTCSSPA